MKYDPQEIMGKADGVVKNAEGKNVGLFWENPATKGMNDIQRKAYWKAHDEKRRQ